MTDLSETPTVELPFEVEAALIKTVGDMIRDHAVLNMEWGPLGYDEIAFSVVGTVRAAINAELSRRQKDETQ